MVRLEMQLSWWWRSTHGALGSVTGWHHTEWATVMPVPGLGRCRREDQKFKVILIQPEINEFFFLNKRRSSQGLESSSIHLQNRFRIRF